MHGTEEQPLSSGSGSGQSALLWFGLEHLKTELIAQGLRAGLRGVTPNNCSNQKQ